MKLAVNYSPQAEDLLISQQIQFDCFKCPGWPNLVADLLPHHSIYVHFPLKVGQGSSDAMDTETNQPAEWGKVEKLLMLTGTRFVNLHIMPTTYDYPDIPNDTIDPQHTEMLLERTIRDVQAVTKRFGAERVMVENDYAGGGGILRPATTAEFIRAVVEAAGCGFLLDLAHAHIAAQNFGLASQDYIAALPVQHICEVHITGVRFFGSEWIRTLQRADVDSAQIQRFSGRLMDHLPMTDEDWRIVQWAVEQIQAGHWKKPEIIALELGGIGKLWQAITDSVVLREQVPRLWQALQPIRTPNSVSPQPVIRRTP